MNKDKVFYFTGIFKTVEDDEIAQDYVAEVDCHINNLAPEGFLLIFLISSKMSLYKINMVMFLLSMSMMKMTGFSGMEITIMIFLL